MKNRYAGEDISFGWKRKVNGTYFDFSQYPNMVLYLTDSSGYSVKFSKAVKTEDYILFTQPDPTTIFGTLPREESAKMKTGPITLWALKDDTDNNRTMFSKVIFNLLDNPLKSEQ